MTEAEIKTEMRLWALECAFCQAIAVALKSLPATVADEMLKTLEQASGRNTFSKVDPALSDHLSAEFEVATRRLVKMMRDYMAVGDRGSS